MTYLFILAITQLALAQIQTTPIASCPLIKCAPPTVQCFADPCQVNKCAADPNAVCCRGCNCDAFFVDKETGAAVDCDTDACKLPLVTGSCKAYFPRWGFNATSGRCERFIYGGCGGNANNFQTEDECAGRCPPKQDCRVVRCASPESIEGACKEKYGNNYAILKADPENGRCCDLCQPKEVLDCRVVLCAPLDKARCEAAYGADGYIVVPPNPSDGKCCETCEKKQPVSCALVLCLDKASVEKQCIDKHGAGNYLLVEPDGKSQCCHECKPKRNCDLVRCADKSYVDSKCREQYGAGNYVLLEPDKGITRCCYECSGRATLVNANGNLDATPVRDNDNVQVTRASSDAMSTTTTIATATLVALVVALF